MTDQEFTSWKERHKTLFAFTLEIDDAMFECWREVFEDQGFSFQELWEATTKIAKNPPKWRDGHLRELQQSIRHNRTLSVVNNRQKYPDADFSYCCDQCQDTGITAVPHPSCLRSGFWIEALQVYSLTCVACDCGRGEQLYERARSHAQDNPRARVPVRLVNYELDYCANWRELLKQKSQLETTRFLAHQASKIVDGTYKQLDFPKLLQKIAAAQQG